MSNPTSNFGWQMPTNSDLVTDLPADFEVFGQGVDTTLADLKGGTSGQILSKNTNADMDFVWINNDQGDITGVTATSPLTGGGTSGAITVGIQSASTTQSGAVQLTDSTSSTSTTTAATPNSVKTSYDLANSAYAPAFTNNFYAGKNKIINGDFGIWQRGTSFSATNLYQYTADRWFVNSFGGTTGTLTQQTFTAGAAPVAGYEGAYYANWTVAGSPSASSYFLTRLEDVRLFAGQTVTISFWAKAASAKTIAVYIDQNYGSGGSATTSTILSAGQALTTSWVRYSFTGTLGSIAGKTIGTSSYIAPTISVAQAQGAFDISIWGVQLEAGSTATPFQTATGTKQGELAACQRYYTRWTAPDAYTLWGVGVNTSSTGGNSILAFPTTMRTKPSSVDYSTVGVAGGGGAVLAVTALTLAYASDKNAAFGITVASGLTAQNPHQLFSNNSTSAYIGVSAEL